MRLPWRKVAEAEKSTSASESGVHDGDGGGGGNPTTPFSEQPLSNEILDPEKRPLPVDTKSQGDSDRPASLPSPPAAAGAPDTDEKHAAEIHDEALARRASTSASSAGEPGEDDESKYATGLPLHLLTFGLTLSTFVIALDNTIIATAIPRITTVFNSLDDVGWYGSSYLLTTTSLQPSFGKIYTYFNVKWTYMIALVIFEVGSVLCGAAVNSTMLIVGRAVAGVGAAAMFSGGMTIVGYSVPLRKRPIYIGLLSSMFGIASVVGPILGGALTDRM
jgi:hypothetical protein